MKVCALFLILLYTSLQAPCTFSPEPMNFLTLGIGFLEGLFVKLSALNAQMCLDSADTTVTWTTELIKNITECKYSVVSSCTTDTVIKSIAPLMGLLSKLVLNCGDLPAAFVKVYTTMGSIFSNFDAYTKRVIANALTLLGLLVNYGTSGYLSLCSYSQYKKAGIEFGEAIGSIVTQ